MVEKNCERCGKHFLNVDAQLKRCGPHQMELVDTHSTSGTLQSNPEEKVENELPLIYNTYVAYL